MMLLNKVLCEDIDNIICDELIAWDDFKNSVILVTGASGFVGSMLCKSFLAANEKYDLCLKVIALVRNEDKATRVFSNAMGKQALSLAVGDVCLEINVEDDVDYIFHCASVTSSKYMISNPVETIMSAVQGTSNILKFASVRTIKSFVYMSSMEMYGSFEDDREVYETDYGFVDPLQVRSNYPEGKRMCENMCIAYCSEYGVPVKIARLAQTFGAGVSASDNRVFAQFARAAINGENIVLHTEGKSEGNYCYITDTVKALLILAIKGEVGGAYNVVNPATHTTIADMAAMVADIIESGRIKIVFDIPESNVFGYAQSVKLKLNSDKLQRLGWKPQVDLEESFRRLIAYYMECDE